MDANLGKHFTITGSFIYQMQYTSTGPDGSSANYMKYGILPEVYAGLSYRTGGFLAKAGVSLLSIKPRNTGVMAVAGSPEVKVDDRMTALSPFLYLQYKYKTLTVKAKTIYGSAADYLNLVSGYGITSMSDPDGHYDYAATHTSSSWVSVSVGKKLQGMFMAGYIANLGATKDFVDTGDNYYFFAKDGQNFKRMAQAFRLVPTIAYNIGKFTLGLEYEVTAAQFGDNLNPDGSVMKEGTELPGAAGLAGRYWVANHRIQLMTKFTF